MIENAADEINIYHKKILKITFADGKHQLFDDIIATTRMGWSGVPRQSPAGLKADCARNRGGIHAMAQPDRKSWTAKG